MSDEDAQNTIQLDTLSLDQLQQLQQREERRMQGLTTQYAELRSLAARLHQSAVAVKDVTAKEGDEDATGKKDMFIPLTESVYIPGKVQLLQPDEKDLMVELGTGYFVEKTSKQTLEYLDRKIKIVDGNSDNGAFVLFVLDEAGVFVQLFYYFNLTSFPHSKFLWKVTQAVQATRQNLEAISMAARGKMLEIQARQQGRMHRAGEGS